jgi:hypothetical protein
LQNLPVSAILIFWQWSVSSSIADWKILEDIGILVFTSICTSIGTDCTGSCKSNYHTTTTHPFLHWKLNTCTHVLHHNVYMAHVLCSPWTIGMNENVINHFDCTCFIRV